MNLTRSVRATLAAVALSTVVLAIAIVLVVQRQIDTNDMLCRTAQRSAGTKDMFVDVFQRAFEGSPTAAPFVSELRIAVAQEREILSGYCPPHE